MSYSTSVVVDVLEILQTYCSFVFNLENICNRCDISVMKQQFYSDEIKCQYFITGIKLVKKMEEMGISHLIL